jgi:hypothetical protein
MFIAIIYIAYIDAEKEIDKKIPELMFDDFIKAKYGRLADKFKKKNRMLDAEEVLNTDEALSKFDLDFKLWRSEMKVFYLVLFSQFLSKMKFILQKITQKKGYTDIEIEAFFSKYDKDLDRALNKKEKKALLFDIKKAKSHIEQKFQKYSVLSEKEQNEEQETDSALVPSF